MVHLRKGRFPQGNYSKLKNKNFGPCQIIRKISNNAYKVDLPTEFNMSDIFNISDLRKYYPPIPIANSHLRTNVADEEALDGLNQGFLCKHICVYAFLEGAHRLLYALTGSGLNFGRIPVKL